MSDGDGFSGVRSSLENGFSRASGALKKAYVVPRDAVYDAAGVRDEDGDIDQGRRRLVQGLGVVGLGAGVGVTADKYSDDELDGNLDGGSGPLAGIFGNQNDPSDNSTTQGTGTPGSDASTEASTDSPTETGTDQGYSGQIDGSGYELEDVPGPVEGQGYQVSDEVLESYDPDGWEDITDEEEYGALGTGADWYVQEDAVVGINERQQVSRTFPGAEFNYDTDGLYEDIREEAN